MIYRSGDVVLCHYNDLDGNKKQGIFCISYCEKFDDCTDCGNNVVAYKITSQYQEKYKYYVELISIKSLQKESRICCTKPYVFKASNIVCKLGTLNNIELMQFKNKLKLFHLNTIRQIEYEEIFEKGRKHEK